MQEKDVQQNNDALIQNQTAKWNKINFFAIIITVLFILIAVVEIAVMDFFTPTFTIIFLSVVGGLAVLSAAVYVVSFIKLRSLKKLQLYKFTDENDRQK